ncbi:MAG TPA: cupredoxin domain-containing protein [Pyrinomonadaceae bacterium]|nr:cupredoxin domain-containing protein [Pyrinomonadaceae bacterium]
MRRTAIIALVALLFGIVAAQPAAQRASAEDSAAASVAIKDFEFQPKELKVKTGATVTWTNDGSSSHTVTSDDGSFESPTFAKGKTYSRKFDKPGTYPYYCALHGGAGGDGMSGAIVVTP